MARGNWGQGPIDIGGGGGSKLRLPDFPRPGGRGLQIMVVAVVVLVLLFTGYYQVEPDEVAVVLRFGRLVRTTEPGPHLKLPFGIESVIKVPVQRQLKEEFGFRTERSGTRTTYAPD